MHRKLVAASHHSFVGDKEHGPTSAETSFMSFFSDRKISSTYPIANTHMRMKNHMVFSTNEQLYAEIKYCSECMCTQNFTLISTVHVFVHGWRALDKYAAVVYVHVQLYCTCAHVHDDSLRTRNLGLIFYT